MIHRLLIISLSMLLFAACVQDRCGSVQCRYEGVCVQGECACAYAYEGQFCENRWYDKFNHTWSATDMINKDTARVYILNIAPGSSPDTFYILGLGQIADTVVCTRKAYRQFTMHERMMPDSTVIKSGEGLFNDADSTVTGVYSFSKMDVITNLRFAWHK